ncbi:MAG: acyl carrier protein [Planctomycetota bacterium]
MGLDSVELILDLELRFKIKIPDAQAESMRTVGDLANCVWALLNEKGDPGMSRARCDRLVRVESCRSLRVRYKQATLDAHLVDDLGCD